MNQNIETLVAKIKSLESELEAELAFAAPICNTSLRAAVPYLIEKFFGRIAN